MAKEPTSVLVFDVHTSDIVMQSTYNNLLVEDDVKMLVKDDSFLDYLKDNEKDFVFSTIDQLVWGKVVSQDKKFGKKWMNSTNVVKFVIVDTSDIDEEGTAKDLKVTVLRRKKDNHYGKMAKYRNSKQGIKDHQEALASVEASQSTIH